MDVLSPLALSLFLYASVMLVYCYLTGYVVIIGAINIVSSPIIAGFVALSFKKLPHQQAQNQSAREAYLVLGSGILAVLMCLVIFCARITG